MKYIGLVSMVLMTLGSWAEAKDLPGSSSPSILFIPFAQVGQPDGQSMFSQAIQEELMAQAAQLTGAQPKALSKPLNNARASEALQAAREVGAVVVVYGSYQTSDDQLRVSGQVVEVASEHVMGVLRSTGTMRDMFKIEDELAGELQSALFAPSLETNPLKISLSPLVSAPTTQSSDLPASDDFMIAIAEDPAITNALDTQPSATTNADTPPTQVINNYNYYYSDDGGYGYGYGSLYPYAPGYYPFYSPILPFGGTTFARNGFLGHHGHLLGFGRFNQTTVIGVPSPNGVSVSNPGGVIGGVPGPFVPIFTGTFRPTSIYSPGLRSTQPLPTLSIGGSSFGPNSGFVEINGNVPLGRRGDFHELGTFGGAGSSAAFQGNLGYGGFGGLNRSTPLNPGGMAVGGGRRLSNGIGNRGIAPRIGSPGIGAFRR